MISDLQKEKIAIQVIRTLYSQFDKFPEDVSKNRNAPFHEAFLKAFTNKLEGKVSSIPIFISLSSWMHGLNTSLGQSFFENVANMLCNGTKKDFTTGKKSLLQLSPAQKVRIAKTITDLSNGNVNPDLVEDEQEILDALETLEESTGFTADVFFEDDEQVVCIELKTVKPNKGVFKVEKQKILEAKSALRHSYPNKKIKFFVGFPFDPLSSEPTGYDKQRFMKYSVDFRKYFGEKEFLLSAELWDYLSGTTETMKTILEIINSIATTDFLDKLDFLSDKNNLLQSKVEYLKLLDEWSLKREKTLIEKEDILRQKMAQNKSLIRVFNQGVFVGKGEYNENRVTTLLDLVKDF